MSSIASLFIELGLSLSLVLSSVLVFFYVERKGSAFIQDRLGPTHVGRFGLLQPLADLLKLVQKETIVPSTARRFLFLLAPFVVFAAVFSGFALLPLWADLSPFIPIPGGLLLLLGVISIDAIGILMASYASQSKFPMLGAGRAVSQMVSYEVPLGISFLCFFWICNSVQLSDIQNFQLTELKSPGFLTWPWHVMGIDITNWGGFFQWNFFRFPILLFLLPGFYICILAESHRAPFDLPEGESEIVGGFHTEYSGYLWAIFFLAEYAMMLILSLIMSYLFFGGAASPIPHFGHFSGINEPSFFWLLAKAWLLGFSMIWIRWTLPRLRIDQLLKLCWKVVTPIALFVFLVCLLGK